MSKLASELEAGLLGKTTKHYTEWRRGQPSSRSNPLCPAAC